jgi:hypothetical protein
VGRGQSVRADHRVMPASRDATTSGQAASGEVTWYEGGVNVGQLSDSGGGDAPELDEAGLMMLISWAAHAQ